MPQIQIKSDLSDNGFYTQLRSKSTNLAKCPLFMLI